MSSGIRSLTKIQVGKEATRGTGVAATRRVPMRQALYRRQLQQERLEGLITGQLARVVNAPVATRHGTEFEVQDWLNFDDVLLPLLSGVKGAVTPTEPGTGEARLWTFTPPVTGDPAPDTFTVEFEEGSPAATAGMKAPYGFTTEIEITATEDGLPELRYVMMARKTLDGAATGSLSVGSPAYAANSRWAVSIDGAWATLGTTPITGQVYGLTWRFSGHLRPAYYFDNRPKLDFSNYEVGIRQAELMFDVVHDPASGKLVQTEEAARDTGALRAVRVQLNGPAFKSPDTALHRFIRIDGAYYHAEDSLQERGRERDGLLITSVHLLSAYESTQAQDIQVAVQNSLASYP